MTLADTDFDAAPTPPAPAPLILVLSGPSGAGKDAIIRELKRRRRPYAFVVTMTTRPPRPDEVDGVDYHFVSSGEFQRLLERDALLEHANYTSASYGVPAGPIRDALERGRDVVVRVDVQGVRNLQPIIPDAVYIFITAPSLEALRARMERRGDAVEEIERRLAKAAAEMQAIELFDYVVVNEEDGLTKATDDVEAIATAERLRVRPRQVALSFQTPGGA